MPVDDRSAERAFRSEAAPVASGRTSTVRLDVFARHVLEGCADAVFVRQPGQPTFAYVNAAAARLTGHSRRELLAMNPLDLVPGLSEDELLGVVAPLVRGDVDVVRVERTIRTRWSTG